MDFGFNEQQEVLRGTARRFFESECPMTFVREVMAHDTAHSSELWKKMTDLGWLGIIYPEKYGGIGGDFIDLTVLAEEMGRAVMPGPYMATVILGGIPILLAGTEAQKEEILSQITNGNLLMTLALPEPVGRYDAEGVTLKARSSGDHYLLNGVKLFVPDAHVADKIVVAARTRESNNPQEGITLFLVDKTTPGVSITQLKGLDMTRRLCEVSFTDARIPQTDIIGNLDQGWPILRRTLDYAKVALCAEMVGGAQKVLDICTEYAKTRVQFGRPIGVFQAVSHKCVSMLIDVEFAKSIVYYAAWAVDANAPEATSSISMAKAWCSDIYSKATAEGIQLHGGIGFTWDYDMHIYYRRARTSELAYGDGTYHRELVAQNLAL